MRFIISWTCIIHQNADILKYLEIKALSHSVTVDNLANWHLFVKNKL